MEKDNNIIEDEFDLLQIGTGHNTKRAKSIMSNMLENPGKSVLAQSSSRSEAKAAYQFFNNENFVLDDISRVHHTRTIERIVEIEQPILVLQDTTYVDYTSQTKKAGRGKISARTKGAKIHTSIATSREGLNLGVLHQLSICKEQDNEVQQTQYQQRTRPIEDKESYRWIESFHESMYGLPDDIDVTVISDREGDIYEYMNAVNSKRRYFLMRVAQNRITTDNEKILDSIKKSDSSGEIYINIPRNTHKKVESRKANMEIRFKKYEIKRPVILNGVANLPDSITVYVIHVIEANTPVGVEPIEWFLMTNRVISNANEAVQQIQNYMQRWKIERFHYVLKSGGCKIEDIQARSMQVTLSMIMIYSIISVFIMNMTYAARLDPDAPCSIFFEEEEWKLLYSIIYATTEIPATPINIKEAIKLVAWLGGGKRPPSDGEPGLKLIWQGLEKLYCICKYKDRIIEYENHKKLTVQV